MLPDHTPNSPDSAGVISWVHFGDLHMESVDGQNYQDLFALVLKVNQHFAQSASFAFFPGDNADEGSAAQYEVVRSVLDRLQLPWRAIVGDHDVHEKSFSNFVRYMSPAMHYSFQVGSVCFIALNAFSTPDPKSFDISDDQLDWLEEQLEAMPETAHAVLLLHCYPTDLKQGGERLRELIKGPRVLLIDMGHTHYNEVANDGATLYTATRSTGQIEEGPVGFSVTNIDGAAVSWAFLPLAEPSLVMITSPADERFVTLFARDEGYSHSPRSVRAKFWGDLEGVTLRGAIARKEFPMQRVAYSQVWQASLPTLLEDGWHDLVVTAHTRNGREGEDRIGIRVGGAAPQQRAARDQGNALATWPERGLLATQLGPNKNGKKW